MRLILALLLLASCEVAQQLPPEKPDTEIAFEVPAKRVEVRVVKLTDFTVAQAARFTGIAQKLEEVINSPEFKLAVESHTHKGELGYFDYEGTPASVYEKLAAGPVLLEYILKRRLVSTSTIGYTLPSVSWIALYADKLRSLSDAELAANQIHEWGHKLGFKHSAKWTKDRPYSVPYALGSIVKRLYLERYSVKNT
jgi:hypothetical protein